MSDETYQTNRSLSYARNASSRSPCCGGTSVGSGVGVGASVGSGVGASVGFGVSACASTVGAGVSLTVLPLFMHAKQDASMTAARKNTKILLNVFI